MIEIEDICEPEWAAWYRMTPQERWKESEKLWHHYVAMGGSLDPEPDPQSPFYDPETSGRPPVDGRPSLRVVRGSGVWSRSGPGVIAATKTPCQSRRVRGVHLSESSERGANLRQRSVLLASPYAKEVSDEISDSGRARPGLRDHVFCRRLDRTVGLGPELRLAAVRNGGSLVHQRGVWTADQRQHRPV